MHVLIADDHVLISQAMAHVLREGAGFDVSTAGSRQDTLEQLAERDFDVVLLDLRMPGMQGLPSVAEVVGRAGEGKVVLFSAFADQQFVDDAISLGATGGYIPKSMPLKSLELALKLIASGQTFIPRMTDETLAVATDGQASLSDREIHMLRLVADGETNKEIARDLSVTETQVKMMMRSVCAKLKARNRAHASIIARERMLI